MQFKMPMNQKCHKVKKAENMLYIPMAAISAHIFQDDSSILTTKGDVFSPKSC